MLENASSKPVILPVQELENTVWNKDVCAGCRACLTICPSNTIAYDEELNRPYQITPCVDCKVCMDICPRTPANMTALRSPEIIGDHIDILSARSLLENSRSQNGGVVSSLLITALEEDFIDCALVMGSDRWAQKAYPMVAYDADDVLRSAGSKYDSNAVIESFKEIAEDPSIRNVALVGTPCAIEAMGLLRKSGNEYAQKFSKKLRFTIGLFCFESFSDSMVSEVVSKLGISSWDIEKMNAGEGKLTVTLRGGDVKSIPLQSLAYHIKPGCHACADFTSKYSDISVGSVGSKPGSSTVIIRTVEGKGLFNAAVDVGLVETQEGVSMKDVEKVGKLKLKRNNIA
ncbi:hydrogenase [Methanocella sp. CWC-04]|uniref:Hydrogenase n=1 Tax=Methanooceanicella nereidis TaxID=2052831 RepID=A0AAP2W555_9EURY|nr:Coenzyme F420 hydrogenase/dehydrogenase, beta subunit C-terminal domain [Methanocella sp. CWC-04]MCD1295140.1 hydrogenase [Methanocella sp. CWC-04]